jgi:hypothetical protein
MTVSRNVLPLAGNRFYPLPAQAKLLYAEVRRAPFGPGLCRQARWAGRGSSAQGRVPRSFLTASQKRSWVPLTLEGPARTMRGVPTPAACDIPSGDRHTRREAIALAVQLAGAAARYGGYCGGRSPGVPSAAARHAWRASAQRARRKAAAHNGETQVEPRPLTAGHPGRSLLATARARPRGSPPWAVRSGAPKVRP